MGVFDRFKRGGGDPAEVPEEVAAVPTDREDAPEIDALAGDPVARLRGSWRRQWQAPAMVLAAAMLALGLGYGVLTRPKARFAPTLDRAERLIERDRFQDALRVLNDPERGVHPWLSEGDAVGPIDRRRYHTLVARAIYLGQQSLGVDLDENHLAIVREYQAAERDGATLSPKDTAYLAHTFASRGEADLALARARTIPDGAQGLRDEVFRRVVDRWLDTDVPRYDRAQELLTELLTDPGQPVEQRVWALSRQAQVQIGQGFADQAITRLLRAIPRLEGASATDTARLHVLLGEAYLKTGAVREAGRQLAHAVALEPGEDELRAQARVLIARVHEAQGELVEARDLYSEVVEQYAGTSWYLPALLGLAQTESGLGATAASTEAYQRLLTERAELSEAERAVAHPRAEEIAQSLLERYLEQTTAGEPELALRFATLASQLSTPDTAPTPVLEALASGHTAVASRLLGVPAGEATLDTLAALDPSTRAEVQRHLLRAAAHERLRADRSVLSDNEQFADALWNAAELFDRAGDQPSAAEAFREFADGVPGSPLQAEARWRLGQAYQAMGDHALAEEQFRGLIEDQTQGVGGAGPVAARSHVPLAQCLLADDDQANDAEAERLLLAAVDGTLGLTDSEQFHDALLELGALYYRDGRYNRAVERFDEALARYPDDPDRHTIAYRLADSLRQLAGEIDTALGEPMPDGERQRLVNEAKQHRQRAQGLFEGVIAAMGPRPDATLTRLERVQLRNAYFYLGDLAFDMGDHERAIRAYDAARERYSEDPATLVALVQIVNSYVEQKDFRRARTAHERARRFYLSLPEGVWDDPLLPMDRRDWEAWLDATSAIHRVAGAGAGTPEG